MLSISENTPSLPQDPPPLEEVDLAENKETSHHDLSDSPFAKMFPKGATHQELKGFIDNCLNMLIYDIKRADERAKKASKRLLKAARGQNYNYD